MHRIAVSWLIILGLVAPRVEAQYLTLDFEPPTAFVPRCFSPLPGVYTRDLDSGALLFRSYEQSPWHQAPWITADQHAEGARSLAFGGISGPNRPSVGDRSEVVVVEHRDSWALEIGQRRYLRFMLKVDAASQAPLHWVLIHQAWQCCSGSPPFALELLPSSDPGDAIRLIARVRNSTIGSCHSCGQIVWSREILRGHWYQFIFQYQPYYNGYSGPGHREGQLALWFDEAPPENPTFVYQGEFGYDPALQPNAEESFDLRVGVYRAQQPRLLRVYFDDIRYCPPGGTCLQ